MMLSLIFIVGFMSFFLLPITCITIIFSLQQPQNHHSAATATAAADKPQISSIWRLLFGHVMFPMSYTGSGKAAEGKEDGGERRLAGRQEAGEECRVCLCEVEEGEEISDLRCKHLFHKDCLDAWVGSGHATCPLCRGRVFSPAAAAEGAGSSELLFFQFTSLVSSRRANREGNWWIR
ncbi:hypothetical protein V2J09_012840 [Rumex salicifolius]